MTVIQNEKDTENYYESDESLSELSTFIPIEKIKQKRELGSLINYVEGELFKKEKP